MVKKLLLVGGGGIAQRHLKAIQKFGDIELSLCEPNLTKRESLAKQFRINKSYQNFSEIILSDYDACIIATPANLHVEMGLACAKARLPFLLEKPLSLSMDRVDEMIQVVEENQVTVRVGYLRRSLNSLRFLKEQVHSGKFGKVHQIYLTASQDYRKIRPDYKESYYAKREMGGGVIHDVVSHFIDLAIWFFGPILEVVAYGEKYEFEDVECEDSAQLMLRFKNNPSMMQISINQYQKPNIQKMELAGSEGNVEIDLISEQIRASYDDLGQWDIIFKESNEDYEQRFYRQLRDFIAAVEGKEETNLATLCDARNNLEACLAALCSNREKQIVCIN